jgi:Rha family phage regulatory protein
MGRFISMKSPHTVRESQIFGVRHFQLATAQAETVKEQETIETPKDDLGVKVEDGKVIVSSLDVAKVFGKEHYNVIRDIERLDCSKNFRALNFEGTSKTVDMPNGGVREGKSYNMTRDGFTFLVMGYTGKTAAAFKEAYIKRFNEMEDALRKSASPALPAPAQAPGKLYTPAETAEELYLRGFKVFYDRMAELGIFVNVALDKHRRHWMHLAKPEYVKRGFFVVRKTSERYRMTFTTEAGLEFLRERLDQPALSA